MIQTVETVGAAELGGRLDQLCINTIRTLAMDAVQQAKSGHPGTPMALAPLVYTLWQGFLRFDPDDQRPNRDRFVLATATPRCCFMRCSTL
jgi:transketolase